jgi:hypothetical protein
MSAASAVAALVVAALVLAVRVALDPAVAWACAADSRS